MTQPTGASGGTPFTTQPVVEVLDQNGQRLVGWTLSVTMRLGPHSSGGQLSGATTVSTTTGVAAFSDLSIDKVGLGYTLTASIGGLASASAAFDVIAGPPVASRSSVSIDRSRAVPDDTVRLILQTRDAGGNPAAVAGSTVVFTASVGTGQGRIIETTDHGNGTYTARFVADAAGTLTIGATVNGVALSAGLPTLTIVAFAGVSAGTLAGNGFTCGVPTDGTALCWGNGGFGTLGNGTFSSSLQLQQVGGSQRWSSVAAGGTHVCGLTVNGIAYCWGSGDVGALGNGSSGQGSSDNRNLPVAVRTDRTFEFITATHNASCAITADGDAWCWGANPWGRLGDGTESPTDVPRLVAGSHKWGSIGIGIGQGCGITTGGAAYCWGFSGSLTPAAVPGQNTFRPGSIVVAGNHACALTVEGLAYCWGANWVGQLGDGTTTGSSTPVAVATTLRFSRLTAADVHTCGVTEGGDAYCWGGNDMGQLGDGTHTAANSPRLVVGGSQFTQLSAGQAHTCGVTPRGVALCWGQNNEGQLGDGMPISSRAAPVRVDVR